MKIKLITIFIFILWSFILGRICYLQGYQKKIIREIEINVLREVQSLLKSKGVDFKISK